MMSLKDTIFKNKLERIEDFQFNQEVALAFDDMVSRSIPFYKEIQSIILDILSKAFLEGDLIYDLGCSTGNTILSIGEYLKGRRYKLVGIDNSAPMLEVCQRKISQYNMTDVQLIRGNLEKINFQQCGMAIMNYTLQFIHPFKRLQVLQKIHKSLRQDGIFILSEKIKVEDGQFQSLFTELYYDFKRRNGYTELEISQKREALEKVLKPFTPDAQLELLKIAGFKKVETLFRWYNFACYLGIK